MLQTEMIAGLCNPDCYPHAVGNLHVVETHISWVLLTGEYAYKVKKAVNLGFLDFSTLEARRRYCHEELRLNRRLAPDLYLEVVPISSSDGRLRLGAAGPVVDYAVKMRQFQERDLLDRLQERGELFPGHIDAMACEIAAFHAACPPAPAGGPLGSPENVLAPANQNFAQIAAVLQSGPERPQLDRLAQWTHMQGEALRAAFAARQRDGMVRECHGDLHLGNMFLERDRVRLFDCIEFSENLRWIDVMNEIAFLVMDLWHRSHPELARRFLNAYLERTGDYAGLEVLPYYLAYRAMVRAKVVLLRSTQPGVHAAERERERVDCRRLIGLAEVFAASRPAWLAITHGASGSGKSHYSRRLIECSDAIRIRSDVERKRAFGLAPDQPAGAAPGAGLYAASATRITYARLAALASRIVGYGWPVVADATFLASWQRNLLKDVADRSAVPFAILDFQVPEATLRARVAIRAAAGHDLSEATEEVLRRQLQADTNLAPTESGYAIPIDASGTPEPPEILRRIQPPP